MAAAQPLVENSMTRSPISHAMSRSWSILSRSPSKFFMVLTPKGWRRFRGLFKEPAASSAKQAAYTARLKAQREDFKSDTWSHDGAVSKRRYADYDDYIAHQVDKLDSLGGKAFANPEKAVQRFRRRFEIIDQLLPHGSVLCLGARRGEEVKAFIELGHFAIGIDLNPGPTPELVVVGDFHALNFANESVDCVYMNCLDHAWDLDKILSEICRVLKPGGLFVADIVHGYEEGFAVGNHDTMHWAKARDFGEHIAELGALRLESFRDLAEHGSPQWTQAVMRKI
jgi:SAM-dependent methyltransferase